MATINFYSTQDEYGFLSNFAAYPFTLKGVTWKTSEHYFQAMKFANPKIQREIRICSSPMAAAHAGRDKKKPLRKDWEKVKDSIMYDAVWAKFSQNPDIAERLLATGDQKLVEHTANDSYWGDGGDGSGRNMLGKILEKVRDRLSEEQGVTWN